MKTKTLGKNSIKNFSIDFIIITISNIERVIRLQTYKLGLALSFAVLCILDVIV